jgi:hypothetical protein
MPTGLFIINQNSQTSCQHVLLPPFLLISEKLVVFIANLLNSADFTITDTVFAIALPNDKNPIIAYLRIS